MFKRKSLKHKQKEITVTAYFPEMDETYEVSGLSILGNNEYQINFINRQGDQIFDEAEGDNTYIYVDSDDENYPKFILTVKQES